jgi:hypothetical protein
VRFPHLQPQFGPAGCLDDASWFKPGSVFYTKERPAWDMTAADVDRYEAMPPQR